MLRNQLRSAHVGRLFLAGALIINLQCVHAARVSRKGPAPRTQRKQYAENFKFPDLGGVWFQRRTKAGKEILEKRYYDIIRDGKFSEEERYSAFPTSGCNDRGPLGRLGGTTMCDSEIILTAETNMTANHTHRGANVYKVHKSAHGDHPAMSGYVTVGSSGEAEEMRWNDGKTWTAASREPVDTADFLSVTEGFDDGCSALSGAAAGEPIEWKVNVGNSFALHVNNLPGITVDNVGCVTNVWLAKHQERFACILKKAIGAHHHDSSVSGPTASSVETALEKLRKAMPQNKSAACVPTVCTVVSFPVFPIPSPIPSITLLLAWAHNHKDCNGLNFQEEVRSIELQVSKQNPDAPLSNGIEEAEASPFLYGHGFAFTVFPVPSIAHWHNVQFVNGPKFGPAYSNIYSNALALNESACSELQGKVKEADNRLDIAVRAAYEECPSTMRRLKMHSDMALGRSKSETQSVTQLKEAMSLMPEFKGESVSWDAKLDFNIGLYGQYGTGGITVGWFGGAAFTPRYRGNKFRGCPAWNKVIQLWYENPRTEVNNQAGHEILNCDLDAATL